MSDKELLPCQKMWLKNRIHDIYGGVKLIAPCSYHLSPKIGQIATWDDVDDKDIIPLIICECVRQCRYSCDKQKILLDHILYSDNEKLEDPWADYASELAQLGLLCDDQIQSLLYRDDQDKSS